MPLHNMLEDALSIGFNHIAMASNNPVKIPLVDILHRVRKPSPVPAANPMPDQPLLAIARGIGQSAEYLGEYPRSGADAGLAVLLGGRVVEDEVGLDHGLGRAVQEHDFLVLVRVHVFVGEFGVELGVDGRQRIGFGEDVGEGDVFVLLSGAFLGEAFGTEDFGCRVGGRPGAQVDVVLEGALEQLRLGLCWGLYFKRRCYENMCTYLNVQRGDVFDLAHFRDFLLDFVGQGRGREDGESAGLQAHDGASSADLELAEPREWHGEGGDSFRNHIADHHDLGRIEGDEFGRHVGGFVVLGMRGEGNKWCWVRKFREGILYMSGDLERGSWMQTSS